MGKYFKSLRHLKLVDSHATTSLAPLWSTLGCNLQHLELLLCKYDCN